jgi:membrane-bound metal-dependent hydrolase YbcI (DUF457 family)
MFLGHYGAALISSRAAPRVSLGILFAASQLVDLIWPILLLAGVERIRIVQGENPFLHLVFEHYPWTHSLVMGIVWAIIAGGLYRAVRRDARGAVVVAALVISHWFLDWITHVPDLPLYPGGEKYGLGVWRSSALTFAIELSLFAVGLWMYASRTRGRDAIGRVGFWTLIALMVVIQVANAVSPPPPSVSMVAWSALAAWLFTLWAWWADRHRDRMSVEVSDVPQ